jgi:hypothetical protein
MAIADMKIIGFSSHSIAGEGITWPIIARAAIVPIRSAAPAHSSPTLCLITRSLVVGVARPLIANKAAATTPPAKGVIEGNAILDINTIIISLGETYNLFINLIKLNFVCLAAYNAPYAFEPYFQIALPPK